MKYHLLLVILRFIKVRVYGCHVKAVVSQEELGNCLTVIVYLQKTDNKTSVNVNKYNTSESYVAGYL